MTVKPPRCSLPSMNGPSVITISPLTGLSTVAVLGGCNPPVNTQAPAALSFAFQAPTCSMIGSSTSGGGV